MLFIPGQVPGASTKIICFALNESEIHGNIPMDSVFPAQSCFPWNSRGRVLPATLRTRKINPCFDLMGSVRADMAVISQSFCFPVKPLPPSNVGAELTRNVGLLNVSWTKPVFANRDLTFQIRWNAGNREEIPWQVLSVSFGWEQGSLHCWPVAWSWFLWNLSMEEITVSSKGIFLVIPLPHWIHFQEF